MALFDLGHVAFFALVVQILPTTNREKTFSFKWIWYVLIFVFISGVVIELLQFYRENRTSSWSDIVRNITGGGVGLAWRHREFYSKKQRTITHTLLSLIILILLHPFNSYLYDEYHMMRNFPLLSSFEDRPELSRWDTKNTIAQSADVAIHGEYSLKVHLKPAKYSGIELKFFPSDWQGMKGFKIAVFNPKSTDLKLTFRIHDAEHTKGAQVYSDRFNRTLVIQPGWNQLYFSMDEIRTGPDNRLMNLKKIDSFAFFASNLRNEIVLYIDDVRLTK